MSIYLWCLVIFITSFGLMLAAGWYLARPGQIPPERRAEPRPLPSTMTRALPRAGRFDADWWPDPGTRFDGQPPYGPFPVDTGPLLILSDKAAANVALEREIRQRCAEAEAKIPPRWRS